MSRPLSWTMRDHKEIPDWAITAVENLEHKLEQTKPNVPPPATAEIDAERERCAMICEDIAKREVSNDPKASSMAMACAEMIRLNKRTSVPSMPLSPKPPLGGKTVAVIEAVERERCARLCEDNARLARENGASGSSMALACADRIRVSRLALPVVVAKTPKLDRYVASLRHAMLCPRSDGYEKTKACICERGQIEDELNALKAQSPTETRALVVDQCLRMAQTMIDALAAAGECVKHDGIRITYPTYEVLRLQAERLGELADQIATLRESPEPSTAKSLLEAFSTDNSQAITDPTVYGADPGEPPGEDPRTVPIGGCAFCLKPHCRGGCVT